MHSCDKAKDIEAIDKKVDKLIQNVYGNGTEGLLHTNQMMVRDLSVLTAVISEVQSNVQVLLRFQTQIETKDEVHSGMIKERDVQKRWLIGLSLTTGITLVTLIAGAVFFIAKL